MQENNMMVFEGDEDQNSSLNCIYTQLHITAGGSEAPCAEHESKQLRAQLNETKLVNDEFSVNLSDIFKCSPGQEKYRTVLTKGVAGIGKSFSVKKFTLDWATEDANQDIDFVFSFAFRELNLCSGEKSLHELLTEFHPDLLHLTAPADYVNTKIIVILDGLDESRLPLVFKDNQVVTSVHQKTSVGNLVVNLMKGHLLPDANIWITSRPTAADMIPVEHVGLMTEIRGFNDSQIKEYFQRQFAEDLDLATRITSHIQSSESLHFMCQIPIFCWISALLFQEVFGDEEPDIPQTLTEMMAHFLSTQTRRRMKKSGGMPVKTEESFLALHREFLLKLGKLAFQQLLKNSLIFYEKDLEDCGIDMKEASVCSEFFNTVLVEEKIIHQKKVFVFVHLTVQEFFAALYIFDSFLNNDITELDDFLHMKDSEHTLLDLLKTTVDKVLGKAYGHMDFFMRFLFGLLVEANRRVLGGVLKTSGLSQDTEKKILTHLKSIQKKNISPDGCINLFQTMVEMRDHKVKDEIEEYLKVQDRSGMELTPLHCSALANMLQVSKNDLEVLDLKSYRTSEEGRRRLIPAVRRSQKALLANCGVTAQWVEHLAFGLRFPHSPLRDLDLSNNDLRDSGVQELCKGLESQYCRLERLSLSGCMVTKEGCGHLVSALRSNPTHLKVLDLSYNNPEESGINQLQEIKNDPEFKLSRDACDVTLDPNTVSKNLLLSEGNRRVSWAVEQQTTAERHKSEICLSQQSLKERCYLEVDLLESCSVVLAYGSVMEKRGECELGRDDESWVFTVADGHCYVEHGRNKVEVESPNWHSRLLGVYLDWEAGVLSFYRVSSDSLTCLHTFTETFRDALQPAVRLHLHSSVTFSSPV
ncbi:NLR family CARD domain-containing protein 3-like [Salarias fasciatus]|uniref:NLR family CARD domain-containing protein 3-like n=1 Tax=Salarias fasciatus TaxID=181472 RepID=UPI001176DCC9|nr:NLR family CARD domain-containing protein 3-like [Salarias fasciatus]